MATRTIHIAVTFDMSEIPSGAIITPKETVKEMVINEMLTLFGDDEGYHSLEVDVVDDGFRTLPMDYLAQERKLAPARRLIEPDDFEM